MSLFKQLCTVVCLLAITPFAQSQTQAQKPDKKLQPLPVGCSTSEAMKSYYQKNPAAAESAKKFENYVKNFIANKSQLEKARATSYTIPVVFHVFGTDFWGKTVTVAKINLTLKKLNEDFHGLNDDYNSVLPMFQSRRSTLPVTFSLARIDPWGNPTSGVVFHPVREGFGNAPDNVDDEVQKFAWDNYKYMNVYIQADINGDGSQYSSGVTWYPDTWMSDNNLARCVYNGQYIYPNSDNKEFSSTLTHEFGHYLNLQHTFENGCDAPGDEVDDTPPTTVNSWDCNTTRETCAGAGIPNAENYMDYSICYKMFTKGQVDRMLAALNHPARVTLWQASNLAATGVTGNTNRPALVFDDGFFQEADANDGSIENKIAINAVNGAKFNKTGMLVNGTDFTVTNLPAGLTVNIKVLNATKAEISMSGKAASHASANDASGINVTFKDPAIVGGASSLYSATYHNIRIDFDDPYKIEYTNHSDFTVNSGFDWEYVLIGGINSAMGYFYNPEGNLDIETYGRPVVGIPNTSNVSYLASGTVISSSSNFIQTPGFYIGELNHLSYPDYTAWRGKTGYWGFTTKDVRNRTHYGWYKISVSGDGKSVTAYEYATNTQPEGPITCGQKTLANTAVAASDMLSDKNQRPLVYPNPSTGVINIDNLKNGKVYIMDMKGNIVMESTSSVINLSKQSKGIYLVRIEREDGVFTEKVIIK